MENVRCSVLCSVITRTSHPLLLIRIRKGKITDKNFDQIVFFKVFLGIYHLFMSTSILTPYLVLISCTCVNENMYL